MMINLKQIIQNYKYIKNFCDVNFLKLLQKSIKGDDKLEAEVYYDKFKLAAIIIKANDNTIAELLFQGGNTRMENMVLQIDNEDQAVTLTKEGSTNKAIHNFSYTLTTGDIKKNSIKGTYNDKSGEFECINPEDENGFSMKGTLKSGLSGLNIRIDKLQLISDWYVVGNVDVERGAVFKEFPSKVDIDLSTASQMDIQMLLMDMFSKAPYQLANFLKK